MGQFAKIAPRSFEQPDFFLDLGCQATGKQARQSRGNCAHANLTETVVTEKSADVFPADHRGRPDALLRVVSLLRPALLPRQ